MKKSKKLKKLAAKVFKTDKKKFLKIVRKNAKKGDHRSD